MNSIIEKINNEFPENGFDVQRVSDWKNKLDKDKAVVEKQLSLNNGKLPSSVVSILEEAERTSKLTEDIKEKLQDLEEDVGKHEVKIEKVHSIVQEYMDKISLLEIAQAYLQTLKRIEEISHSIESGLNEKGRKVVIDFSELSSLAGSLQDSNCKNLVRYLDETVSYWHSILKEKFTKEFDEVLKNVKWPFHGPNVIPTPSPDVITKLQNLVENLINIKLPIKPSENSSSVPSIAMNSVPLSLPISLLVRPLKKRFIFHFSGNRQTNQSDKPEWYFTQILTWCREHEEFIDKYVQPVYDRLHLTHVSARIEFIRGLVQIAMEKLHWDLPHLSHNDVLFSHTVDEALGFDRELRDGYGYPENQDSVLAVLTKAPNFVKWVNLEKQYSLEKLDNILRSPSAFKQSSLIEEGEMTTECIDSFLTLLSTLTDRYQSLPGPGHKLQFLQLQVELLDDFRVRLLQLLREEEDGEILTGLVPSVLNSIRCLINVLEEWAVTPHFIRLHFYKEQMDTIEGKGANDTSPDSVFSEIINLFTRMEENLLSNLTDDMLMEIKARSRAYRHDKWHAMEPCEGLTTTSIPMFQKLTEQLRILHQVLTPSLRYAALTRFARDLDLFLFEELVLEVHFSARGAQQFSFDMERNLVPLFGQYISKPEAHFRLLMDSCALLTLPQGAALLLQSALLNPGDDDFSHSEVLKDVHVYTLTIQQVKNILRRRIDLAISK